MQKIEIVFLFALTIADVKPNRAPTITMNIPVHAKTYSCLKHCEHRILLEIIIQKKQKYLTVSSQLQAYLGIDLRDNVMNN